MLHGGPCVGFRGILAEIMHFCELAFVYRIIVWGAGVAVAEIHRILRWDCAAGVLANSSTALVSR